LDFRKLVEKYTTEGQVTITGKHILRVKRQEFGIAQERADEIVDEVLSPYQKRLENVELYKEAFSDAIEEHYPLTERLLNELQDFQNILGLEDRDLEKYKQKILDNQEAEYQYQTEIQRQEQEKYKIKLRQYEQEFLKTVEQEYPLSKAVRDRINNLQQSLGIRTEDIRKIEQPILTSKYQEKLIEANTHRQQKQKVEKARQIELSKLQKKLQEYEQEVLKQIKAGYSLDSYYVLDWLNQRQRALGINDSDVSLIEKKFPSQRGRKMMTAQKKVKISSQSPQGNRRLLIGGGVAGTIGLILLLLLL